MKKVVLIRHAKSSWKQKKEQDRNRPLNKRGQKDAQFMGKLLKQKEVYPDLILSSPAKRAYQTAQSIAHEINYPADHIQLEESLYLEGEEGILALLRSLPESIDSVFVFGHNPDMELLAEYFCSNVADSFPTCGILGITCDISFWHELDDTSGTLLFFDFPRNYPAN